MTLKEFVEKYNGKKIDYDGYYGAQCMDLMHQYIDEVLIGKPSPEILRAPSAKLAYETFNRYDLFEKIDYIQSRTPQPGDIMFWKGGEFGHVAVFLKPEGGGFISFDQNYPLGSSCHEQFHYYDNVYGWLRYKMADNSEELILKIEKLENELAAAKHKLEIKGTEITQLEMKLNAMKEEYARLQKDWEDLRNEGRKNLYDYPWTERLLSLFFGR